jgi:hypothetical protein
MAKRRKIWMPGKLGELITGMPRWVLPALSYGRGNPRDYSPEGVRTMRKRNGVGRPPRLMQEASPAYWSRMLQAEHVNRGYLHWMARSALKALA